MNAFLQDALDLLFPKKPMCGLCREHSAQWGLPCCLSCGNRLGIHWQPLRVFGYACFVLTPYQGYIKELLHQIKFEGNRDIALTLGVLLGLGIREEPILQGARTLLPIPLHYERLQKRGFNQSLLLAEGIKRVYGSTLYEEALRVKNTQPQNELAPKDRGKNLKDAFLLPNPQVQGKSIIIVDDIFTSGWTFRTMAGLVSAHGGRPYGVFVAKAIE